MSAAAVSTDTSFRISSRARVAPALRCGVSRVMVYSPVSGSNHRSADGGAPSFPGCTRSTVHRPFLCTVRLRLRTLVTCGDAYSRRSNTLTAVQSFLRRAWRATDVALGGVDRRARTFVATEPLPTRRGPCTPSAVRRTGDGDGDTDGDTDGEGVGSCGPCGGMARAGTGTMWAGNGGSVVAASAGGGLGLGLRSRLSVVSSCRLSFT
mmetsp:Transcript_6639/g.17096  ORF Transcript_6639/g.17096 Transcript_6639/m.17096 type:complete len:208 (-) Transcript_6639:399-1022(-)